MSETRVAERDNTEASSLVDDLEAARSERENKRTDIRSLRAKSVAAAFVGISGLLIYAARLGTWKSFAEVFAAGVLVSGAAALVGILLGFLFGIPRTTVAERAPNPVTDPPGGREPVPAGTSPLSAPYSVNTNLEQISDWLTKILVGVGLTQLNEIPEKLAALSGWLGEGVPNHPETGRFALGAVAYSSAFGFLFGYIWTRVILSPMFRRADEQLLKAMVRQAIAERSAAATIERANARADAVVERATLRQQALDTALRKMLDPLYEDPKHRAYLESIRVAEEYLRNNEEPNAFMFWLRYACAQAQRAQNEPLAEDREDGKRKAIDASRKVLRYSPDAGRYWLSVLSNPNHPDKMPGEDDLQVLFGDAAFENLVGKEPYRMRGSASAE